MKKHLMVGVAVLCATLVGAVETQQQAVAVKPKASGAAVERKKYSEMTPEERAERAKRFKELKYMKTGGRLARPGSQRGSVAFYNGQKRFSETNITTVCAEVTKLFRLNIKSSPLGAMPAKREVADFIKKSGDTFGIFLVEDKDDPTTLSVYPEQRYAVVNVTAVGGDERRFQRELKRTFAFLCGASGSQYDSNILSPVLAPIDLDTIVNDKLPIDAVQRMLIYMKAFDVTPSYVRTYRQAVQEGWAHQPTNDVEKAIWNEVRSIPTKPIKIEP